MKYKIRKGVVIGQASLLVVTSFSPVLSASEFYCYSGGSRNLIEVSLDGDTIVVNTAPTTLDRERLFLLAEAHLVELIDFFNSANAPALGESALFDAKKGIPITPDSFIKYTPWTMEGCLIVGVKEDGTILWPPMAIALGDNETIVVTTAAVAAANQLFPPMAQAYWLPSAKEFVISMIAATRNKPVDFTSTQASFLAQRLTFYPKHQVEPIFQHSEVLMLEKLAEDVRSKTYPMVVDTKASLAPDEKPVYLTDVLVTGVDCFIFINPGKHIIIDQENVFAGKPYQVKSIELYGGVLIITAKVPITKEEIDDLSDIFDSDNIQLVFEPEVRG